MLLSTLLSASSIAWRRGVLLQSYLDPSALAFQVFAEGHIRLPAPGFRACTSESHLGTLRLSQIALDLRPRGYVAEQRDGSRC